MKTKEVLGTEFCRQLPFIHAVNGCGTTSHPFGIGKGAVLSKRWQMKIPRELVKRFFGWSATNLEVIIKTGEEAMVSVYGGENNDSLDNLRAGKFYSEVASSKKSVNVLALPPTSAAAAVTTVYRLIWIFNSGSGQVMANCLLNGMAISRWQN